MFLGGPTLYLGGLVNGKGVHENMFIRGIYAPLSSHPMHVVVRNSVAHRFDIFPSFGRVLHAGPLLW